MQLSRQETVGAFWQGAKKGLVRSIGYIAALAIPVGILLLTGLLDPISPTVAVITALSTALTVGMFSGHTALSNYHQQKHNEINEARIARLEGRAPIVVPEQDHNVHSPKITAILQEGARTASSHADAEEARANAPTTPTIQ